MDTERVYFLQQIFLTPKVVTQSGSIFKHGCELKSILWIFMKTICILLLHQEQIFVPYFSKTENWHVRFFLGQFQVGGAGMTSISAIKDWVLFEF